MKKPETKKAVFIRVDHELRHDFRRAAARNGMTIQDAGERLLRQYVRDNQLSPEHVNNTVRDY